MSKRIDKKLKELGYDLTEFNEHFACHMKKEPEDYVHKVDICYKDSGKHLIFSYDSDHVFNYFNPGVGLTELEMRLFLKKLRWMKRKFRW